MAIPAGETLSRATFLVGALAAGAMPIAQAGEMADEAFEKLDHKIRQGMQDFAIPGVAVGVVHGDKSYIRCYGVTDIRDPRPVNAHTVFRIASNTKTFTGTAAMRLVDSKALSLDALVTDHILGFKPPPGAGPVSVRQVLNHSAGWLGYDYHETGKDDGALARYVGDIRHLPQLTPVGEVFSYNNAALSVAGRVIETVTGATYENSLHNLVLRPLGMSRTGFTLREVGNTNIATPHVVIKGKAVASPESFYLPRSCNPFGGLLSSVPDMLVYARFHLGDGLAANGRPLMSKKSLRGMWATHGPGGTLAVELEGVGVSWMIRPTSERVTVIEHGGHLPGFPSGFMLVPDRRFAMVMLTNSEDGQKLLGRLFYDDWALRQFAGVSNLHAVPHRLSPSALAPYEGTYTFGQIGFTGPTVNTSARLTGVDGGLRMIQGEGPDLKTITLTFYKDDYVLVENIGMRANFLRDAKGRVQWLRLGGRLYRHVA
jgi:CubicO group peptidase (beta-lactamase class C family)